MKKFILILFFVIFVTPAVSAFECSSSSQCTIIGEVLIKQQEYLEAIECFDKALEMNPEEYIALAFRAKAKYYLKDYNGVVADATKSLEITENSLAYGVRGSANFELGEIEKCVVDTTKAIEINKNYMKCYQVRAKAKLKLEEYVEALSDASVAVRLDNKCPQNYEIKAKALMGIKDYRTAIEDFNKASELFLDNDDKKNSKEMLKLSKKCKRLVK